MDTLESLVIARRLRVPVDAPAAEPADWGGTAARQLDAALLSAGFTCSPALLERLSGLRGQSVLDLGVRVLDAVRRLVGDHVEHNAYFIDFPANVPDILECWAGLPHEALLDPVAAARVEAPTLNLLSLPGYGRYPHTYADLLAAHAELVRAAGDRVTVLELGGSLESEARELYLSLAGSETPLAAEDLAALRRLAAFCVGQDDQPERIPVRENRAVVNESRLAAGLPLLVDTVTDVLRLACACSGGDVTLAVPTRFRSFRRAERRALLQALDTVASPARLGDVPRHREQWKRLGERLHPHEYPQFPGAAGVFEVARGTREAAGFDSRVEAALSAGRTAEAVRLLENAPGALLRRLDHLLRTAPSAAAVLDAAERAAAGASGRVLLSLREHLQNRLSPAAGRTFVNRYGRAWTTAPDSRPPLDQEVLARALAVLDEEITRRLPDPGELVVDPAMLDVALPLSGKAVSPGLGMLPRGSLSVVDGELLRFFVHWREAARRTDYDLSALMLDASYGSPTHVSWTNYSNGFAEYSGDLTEAPAGASEFIDIRLTDAIRPIVIPQVDIFAGEPFDQAAEAFFGYMTRDAEQQGRPFEPRTVRMKSDLRGSGRVALPLVFLRCDDGGWRVKWLHLYLKGHPGFNQVEGNRVSTSLLVRSIVERDYLNVRYLAGLLRGKASSTGHTTYIGLEAPAGLPPGSRVYTPGTLHEIVPA
ncbi:hypothetical protein MTP10_35110 [Nonomuraea sp. 3-1Str]|uniref:hypothetical protein n=1 Tax=Nonomuraea sp. 3-1Str TaxID=2929801 RepID=UPI00285A4A76|nr:hypothetical protein [Nonomuraea sp. 3-1Str]MDR8413948.1 hypothetical protein [Nonomuraea sp. 3-1Str]